MSSDQTLDIRSEIPRRRHELIFETYGKLGSGDGFVLVNDHDPKPLYYQIEAESKIPFSWEYLQSGPEVWQVKVAKTKV